MAQFFWICAGGAVGTGLRYLVSLAAARAFGTGFPYGTIAVNVVGCFLIVVLMHAGVTRGLLSPVVRFTLTTGVMGGLTTYSSFNYETFRFAQQGQWGAGATNFVVTALGCLVAAVLGQAVAVAAFGDGPR